jgi:threonine dehydrogenase-like Zn-dependent dehydrogenase
MKAVVWHGVGDIRLDEVPEPKLEQPDDAIVRLTVSAICGTDLHMVRGTMAGMVAGTILGHEGVGVVEEVGTQVRNLRPGDRVVIPSTICCGTCNYCRAGYTAQCDMANPHGKTAGTAFFGGPENTGPFQGLQARYARVPYASANLVPLPDMVTDEQAIMLSDIFPTGWFGAKLAEITPGDTVAVFGCGPVGQFAIASARHLKAGRVIAVDGVADRLELARAQHAEVVDYHAEDPVEIIRELTRGSGVDRVVDAVGVDAESPEGPRSEEVESVAAEEGVAQEWGPGGAPSQAAQWSVEAVAKAGTVGIVGVYPPQLTSYPIGTAMNKNLTVNMGNCNHRTYLPELLDLTLTGVIDPLAVLTQYEPASDAIEAYRVFGQRTEGWLKVALDPAA